MQVYFFEKICELICVATECFGQVLNLLRNRIFKLLANVSIYLLYYILPNLSIMQGEALDFVDLKWWSEQFDNLCKLVT